MNSHCSTLMSRLGHCSWRSPAWSGGGCGRSLPGASSDLDAKGNNEPFLGLVFLVRLTTCVGEEFPVVSETGNLLKIGGDHLVANPIRLGGGGGGVTLGLRNRSHWRG